jgi:hypothetical protein
MRWLYLWAALCAGIAAIHFSQGAYAGWIEAGLGALFTMLGFAVAACGITKWQEMKP